MFAYVKNKWNIDDSPYTEFSLSVYRAGDELLKHNRCIFHGAAFLWNKKAFIFTAPSGTGKSTQLFNWLQLYKDEIKIINGDKPILCNKMQNHIDVYPSPWKGKEGIGYDDLTASLGGVIVLKQGNINQIKRLPIDVAVLSLLKRILFTAESRESVLQASAMIEAIVSSVPVWMLTNKGDLDSAKITHDLIQKELGL